MQKKDASKIGLDDKSIYDVIKRTSKEKHVKLKQIDKKECLKPFKKWEEKENNVEY